MRERGNESSQGKINYFSNAEDFEIGTETKTLNKSFFELR